MERAGEVASSLEFFKVYATEGERTRALTILTREKLQSWTIKFKLEMKRKRLQK